MMLTVIIIMKIMVLVNEKKKMEMSLIINVKQLGTILKDSTIQNTNSMIILKIFFINKTDGP